MEPSTPERLALFIDGSNLYAAARALGFEIDYKNLLEVFAAKGRLIRAFYYTALLEDQEYSPIRPLVDWLDYNGYTLVTKPAKEFTDTSGGRNSSAAMGGFEATVLTTLTRTPLRCTHSTRRRKSPSPLKSTMWSRYGARSVGSTTCGRVPRRSRIPRRSASRLASGVTRAPIAMRTVPPAGSSVTCWRSMNVVLHRAASSISRPFVSPLMLARVYALWIRQESPLSGPSGKCGMTCAARTAHPQQGMRLQ